MKHLLTVIIFVSLGLQAGNTQSFPNDWVGKWRGVVEIWSFNEKMDTFPMSLEIIPLDTAWTYTITYEKDADNPDIRKYLLLAIEDSTGHYAVDEQNTIILDAYFNDNCLYTGFGGLGSALLSTICREGELLKYEITSAYTDPVRNSGGTHTKDSEIPLITSHQIYHVMKAVLKRE